jgi:hypothetical protein
MCYTAMLDQKILGMIEFCYEVYICLRPQDLGVSKVALSLLNTAIPALYLEYQVRHRKLQRSGKVCGPMVHPTC